MMTWDRLFADYEAYLAVMVETPYNPDKVQGLGMRFADAWNYHKGPICILLGAKYEDFDYGKWRMWIPQVRALIVS